jgi:hypothetical protein
MRWVILALKKPLEAIDTADDCQREDTPGALGQTETLLNLTLMVCIVASCG